MKITLYIICNNEQLILPHLLNYYSTIVDKIVVYDNESTDDTLKILNGYKGDLEIRTFKTNHQLRDDIHAKIKNTCWIGDDSDYCIVTDADEFIYHPFGLRNYLEQNLDNDFFTPIGYQMISDEFPSDYSKLITEQVKTGTPDPFYNKLSIINPKRAVDINFKPGGHEVHYEVIGPEFKPVVDPNLKLLHYKFLGLDYILNRKKHYPARMSAVNIENGWGKHYTEPDKEIIDHYNRIREASKVIINMETKVIKEVVNGMPLIFKDLKSSGTMECVFSELARDVYGLEKVNLSPNDTVIDIGANIGMFSIYVKKKFGCRVIAFEPVPINIKHFKENVILNGLELSDFELHTIAITDTEDGVIHIGTPDGNTGGSSVYYTCDIQNTCKTETLHKYIDNTCKYLKIDTEGGEYSIIPSILKELNKFQYLGIEFHEFTNEHSSVELYNTIKENFSGVIFSMNG